MSIKNFQQVLVFSKSGKTLVRKGEEKDGLLSFDDRDALSNFLAHFDFDWFILEEHIINLKLNDMVSLEYRAFVVEKEDDLKNTDYIWRDNVKNELFSDEKLVFSIDVPLFLKSKKHYIKCTEKQTGQATKNFTAEQLFHYVSEHGEKMNIKTNFPKNYVLIIINEEGKILRPYRRQNEFATKRMLECCLKTYGFKIVNRIDPQPIQDEKQYCLIKAQTGLRTDCTYYWDEPNKEEERLIVEYKLNELEDKKYE